MTKRESSIEEGGSILQMLAVKGSRREELHDNCKNTGKKKNRSTVGGCFLWLCYEMGSPEGGKVGEKGSGNLVMGKKIRVWLNKEEGQVIGKELVFCQQLRTV